MTRFATFFAVFGMSALPFIAHAGDTSHRHLAIFADQGKTFLFVETGITDGLGAPYANAFAIDVVEDKWKNGFPIRNRMDEQEVHSYEARFPNDYAAREKEMIAKTLTKTMENPNVVALRAAAVKTAHRVSNTPWELSAPNHTARFTGRDLLPSDGKAWRLELEEIPFPASEKCFSTTDTMVGYRLKLTNEKDGSSRLLHEDSRIPKSRGCPLSYAIADVFTTTNDNKTAFAVLLRLEKPGFEGSDRRLMAVTGQLD